MWSDDEPRGYHEHLNATWRRHTVRRLYVLWWMMLVITVLGSLGFIIEFGAAGLIGVVWFAAWCGYARAALWFAQHFSAMDK